MAGPVTAGEVAQVAWAAARREPIAIRYEPAETVRARIAKTLAVECLPVFSVDFRLAPWRDGVEIAGTLEGVAGRLCGLTLEPFDESVESRFQRRLAPLASPNLAPPEAGEVEIDPAEEDPPEEFVGGQIDLARVAMEELSLALDPFPRKPGAVFSAPIDDFDEAGSPFAGLKGFTPRAR